LATEATEELLIPPSVGSVDFVINILRRALPHSFSDPQILLKRLCYL